MPQAFPKSTELRLNCANNSRIKEGFVTSKVRLTTLCFSLLDKVKCNFLICNLTPIRSFMTKIMTKR